MYPFNVLDQETQDPSENRTALIILQKDNKHVYLATAYYNDEGQNILPEYLKQLHRPNWITYYKNQQKLNWSKCCSMIPVTDVDHHRYNTNDDDNTNNTKLSIIPDLTTILTRCGMLLQRKWDKQMSRVRLEDLELTSLFSNIICEEVTVIQVQ